MALDLLVSKDFDYNSIFTFNFDFDILKNLINLLVDEQKKTNRKIELIEEKFDKIDLNSAKIDESYIN